VRVKPPSTLPTARVAELPTGDDHADWLVRHLWGRAAVGFLFGVPKSAKTWLGLDMAVSVASATSCLGRFPVEDPGPTLGYLAADPPHHVRARITALCEHRGLSVADLDLQVITEPSLRLDVPEHLDRLKATVAAIRPRMVLLDPFVRLHRCYENDAQEISGLLGDLRDVQREFDVAIVLVHHARKRTAQSPGEALRGSSDLYAWVDSAAHMAKLEDGRLRLTVEHRSAPAPEPIVVELTSRADGTCTHLQVLGAIADQPEKPTDTLSERVIHTLRARGQPTTTSALRDELQVRNQTIKKILDDLERQSTIVRVGRAGWVLPAPDVTQQMLPFA
jgi:DNA-binding MarR family transcriptional regulator